MNVRQLKAVESLRKALDRCHRAGLTGGVYDMRFYVWPVECSSRVIDGPSRQFFDRANEFGLRLNSDMSLDGGAGA